MNRKPPPRATQLAPEEIISTHESADFDALAAAVAAQKLYPGATIVFGQAIAREVRHFLALHKDRFWFALATDVDTSAVRRWILVDVRRAGRLAAFPSLVERTSCRDPSLSVHIYDHHEDAADDLHGELEYVETLGCATTLLIEQMQKRCVEIDAMEATLFALGIQADTGSLSYPSTTARDTAAFGWLLERGASLRTTRRYLKPRLNGAQLAALVATLVQTEIVDIGGIQIGVAVVTANSRCSGLASVVSAALELGGYDALIVLHPSQRKKIDVVARAASQLVDVGALVCSLGGGGHRSAAAASLKGVSVEELKATILASIRQHPPAARRVRDIMTSPVHSVPADLTLAELAESLDRWQHTGAPVVRDGQLVGIVSRRDVARAERAGRLTLPVSSHMSQNLKTTTPDASLKAALRVMEEADVGRLPVLHGGQLAGIVTRSDVLAILYSAGQEPG